MKTAKPKIWRPAVVGSAITIVILLFIFLPGFAYGYSAMDPTRLVPDARVLGLGKAFIGLAEGTSAIYTNPAGLAEAPSWQITSMSGKFLDEYSYLSFSGLYPTTAGVFGLAYVGSSIGGAFATTIEAGSDPADPIYVIDTSQPEMGNRNGVLALSYGNKADKVDWLKKLPIAERLSFGATLKLFTASLFGDSITGGDASGMDLDLGAKFYPPQKWMTFGLAVQNILPFSMGGKLRYASGHEENYPAVVEGGSVFRILGKENALRTLGDHDVKLMVDFDNYPSVKGYPIVLHVGAEWKPISLLTIRGAIDQDAVGDGAGGLTTVSDNAFGVGLNVGGFNFDYAYHTFAGAPNIDNSYFSLSYGLVPPPPQITEKLVLKLPPDKVITFEAATKVAGSIIDPSARKLTISGTLTKFGLKGEFDTNYDLKVGKNKVVASIYDNNNKIMQSKSARLLRLLTFPDVPVGYWVDVPTSLLAMQNVITGYPDGTFRPTGNITRAEMCTLLMKTVDQITGYGAAARGTLEAALATREAAALLARTTAAVKFKDVSAKHWAAGFIDKAARLGVVKGYPGNVFKPNGKITRAEGLAMIARFAGISEEAYENQFLDLSTYHWAAKIVAGAYKAGLLEFLKGKSFEANKLLLREETVEMIYRTKAAQDLLGQDLLNWDTY